MTIDRETVKTAVGGIFRGARRTWKGYGGVGNPKETWSDLKASVQMAFLLDPDSVFTVAAWAAARLVGLCAKITSVSSDMRQATSELVDPTGGIPDMTGINAAARRLRSVITDIRISANAASSPGARDEVRQNLVDFAQEALLPAASPLLGGTSRRSAAEARKALKTGIDTLIERKTDIADSVVRLATLLSVLAPRMPPLLASGTLQKAAVVLDDMRNRMIMERTADRTANAEKDLTSVSATIVAIDMITRNPMPVLDRGGPYSVNAAGSGTGAVENGIVSAPYRLIEGVYDTIQLDVDGAAGTPVLLPASPATFTMLFPKDEGVGPDFYLATVPWTAALAVNGVSGVLITPSAPAGPYTAAAVAGLLNGLGMIPEDAFGVPYLIIDTVPVGLGVNTVRIQWNPAASPVDMDLGMCVQILGTTEMMDNFGYTGRNPDDPYYRIHREFWLPGRQDQVISSVTRQLGSGVTAEADNVTLMTGVGFLNSGIPQYFYVWNFKGSGEWDPSRNVLTLIGENLGKVRVGDHVKVGPGAFSAEVTEKLPDGVVVQFLAGVPLVSGTYGVVIYPEAASLSPGVQPALHVLANDIDVAYRVTGITNTGLGLRLQSSRALYAGAFDFVLGTVNDHLPYVLRVDRLKITSRNNGALGSLKFQIVADDASGVLGYDHSLVLSTVKSLEDLTADFVAAGVNIGDITILTGLADNVVDSIPTSIRVCLEDEIPGAYTGTARILNARYKAYNDMLPLLSWVVLTDASYRRMVVECIRAPGMTAAGSELAAALVTLEAQAAALKAVLAAYRAKILELSPYMRDVREALDESGADRALALLQSGDLKALFEAGVDDASTERTVLRKIREASRKILGSSVYSDQTAAEALNKLQDTQLLPDAEPLGEESFGPPGSVR